MTPEHRSVIIDSVGTENLRAYCRTLLSILTALQRDALRTAENLSRFADIEPIARSQERLHREKAESIGTAILEADIHLTNK